MAPRHRRDAVLTMLVLLLGAHAEARVEGRVTTSDGHLAVEHARVRVAGVEGAEAYSDADGRFVIDAADAPCTLEVTHPRFATVRIDAATADAVVEVRLAPPGGMAASVVVTANREDRAVAPSSASSTSVKPQDAVAPPSTVADVLAHVPGVAESGQGGAFQTVAVRGTTGQRLATLFAGVPIVTDRRAGAALSFADPLLVGSLDVVRGPASTLYGSGALGGVVQGLPARFDGLTLDLGYDSHGDERRLAASWGNGTWSLGVAGRAQDDGETPAGQKLNDHFTQGSALLSGTFDLGGKTLDVVFLPAIGRDIGKDNTDPPARVTDYPEESHVVASVRLAAERWSATLYAHPNDLETDVRRANGDHTAVTNESFDFGGGFQMDRSFGAALSFHAGVDAFARRGVDSRETRDTADGREELQTLHGSQDELAVYATLRYHPGRATLLGGARLTYHAQNNAGHDRERAAAPSAFVGVSIPVGAHAEAVANAGTGLRFPSLTERFFTGTTGRGGVAGNPDLDAERSYSADAGIRVFGQTAYVEAFLFHNEVRDYIEQVPLDDDVDTFVNLRSGSISGAEIDVLAEVGSLHLLAGGAIQRGRDDDGQPLADVPPARIRAGVRVERGRFRAATEIEERFRKDDPAAGEKEIASATLLSARASVTLPHGFEIALSGANLLDEEYFRAADEKAPLAAGRSFGISLTYRR